MKSFFKVAKVFGIFGILMLIVAIFLYQSTTNFLDKAVLTDGKVIDLEERYSSSSDNMTYAPVVVFKTINRREIQFVSTTSSYPPAYDIGEEIEIYYDPADPEDASINGFFALYAGTLIFAIFGGFFTIIPAIILIAGRFSKNKIEKLQESGKSVFADLISVDLNYSLEVNGRSPFTIATQWENPNDGIMYVFKSENIWFNPEGYVKNKIEVLINEDNPKVYHMPLDFLPKQD